MPAAINKISPEERNVVYRYHDGIYVNLTNRCPTACRFCIKFTWKMKYRDYDLKLNGMEPTVSEVIDRLREAHSDRAFNEIVFCGYGESTYRVQEMVEICLLAKRIFPNVKTRLNTVGLGNLVNRRSIAKELAAGLDAVSISLNTVDPDQWTHMMNPIPEFKENGLKSVLDFIRECARVIPETTATAVAQPNIDIPACRKLVKSLGAKFRERPLLSDYEGAETR